MRWIVLIVLFLCLGCVEKRNPLPAPPITSGWHKGPMPSGTWNWGGVVPLGEQKSGGFYFADFRGDFVVLCPSGKKLMADDIAYYNNSIELPPKAPDPEGKFGSVKPTRLE
jgi:hypothetical protein